MFCWGGGGGLEGTTEFGDPPSLQLDSTNVAAASMATVVRGKFEIVAGWNKSCLNFIVSSL